MNLKKKTQAGINRNAKYQPRPQVFSYHAKRSPDSINRDRRIPASGMESKKSGRLTWQQLPGLIAVITIVISIVYLFVLEPVPRLEIAGDDTEAALLRDDHVYQKAAADILRKSIFNRTKLTINTEEIADELKRAFPEIKSAVVTIPIASHNPVVKIEPAEPAFIILASGAQPTILDSQGRAVVAAGQVANLGDLKLTRIFDESGLEIKPRQTVISRQNIEFITAVTGHLKAAGISTESLSLPAIPQELHVKLSGHDFYVKFDMTGEAKVQTGSLLAFIETLKETPSRPAEYIDVRVPGRVFHK